jgi:nitrate reductase NapAB chaperone NapD
MPLGGIVVSLVSDPGQALEAIAYLGAQPDIEVGVLARTEGPLPQQKLPAVLETRSAEEAEDRIRHLRQHPGIFNIDVVYVGFSEADQLPANPMERPGRKNKSRSLG